MAVYKPSLQSRVYTCVIADDNPHARYHLRYLVDHHPEIKLKGLYTNVHDAIVSMQKEPADIFLLDPALLNVSALNFLKRLSPYPEVIFTTVGRKHSEFAADLEVVDYLLKPIGHTPFFDAINRAINELRTRLRELNAHAELLVLRNGKHIISLKISEIVRFESLGDYVKIISRSGVHTVHTTMKTLVDIMKPLGFERVHRSHLVRVDAIEKVKEKTLCVGGTDIPVSEANRGELLKNISLGGIRI